MLLQGCSIYTGVAAGVPRGRFGSWLREGSGELCKQRRAGGGLSGEAHLGTRPSAILAYDFSSEYRLKLHQGNKSPSSPHGERYHRAYRSDRLRASARAYLRARLLACRVRPAYRSWSRNRVYLPSESSGLSCRGIRVGGGVGDVKCRPRVPRVARKACNKRYFRSARSLTRPWFRLSGS